MLAKLQGVVAAKVNALSTIFTLLVEYLSLDSDCAIHSVVDR